MRSLIPVLGLVFTTVTHLPAQQMHGQQDSMRQQMMMRAMMGPLGIPLAREGSGTSWLPDSTSMQALHAMAGSWLLMLHGNVFAQYIDEGGDRGDHQFGSINWIMAMARRPLAGGFVMARVMMSAEPATVRRCGYPDMLATGEFCRGEPLHDRQHPHDLFMELAAGYERQLTRDLAFQVYGGPVGEPALGPVAYPHRPSAMPNPIAPIGHHWFDATHIAFGVVTAGLFGRRWKLEGSVFNGREPDEERYNIDLDALDSYSGRLWILPSPRWALQGSIGRLTAAEPGPNGEPRRDVTRSTASLTYHQPLSGASTWTAGAMWGHNVEEDHATDAFLIETSLTVAERNLLFARGELARKQGEDLALEDPALQEEAFTVGRVAIGYTRELRPILGLVPGIGGRVAVSLVPADLERFYGTRSPLGFALFVNLRPAAMSMSGMTSMQHMQHGR
jgi:hypothetical protein